MLKVLDGVLGCRLVNLVWATLLEQSFSHPQLYIWDTRKYIWYTKHLD